MMRRMTSRSGEKPVEGLFSSLGNALNDNKYLIVGGAVVLGGVFFLLNTPDKKPHRNHRHHTKKGGLQAGNTVIDANSVRQGKSLRVGTVQTERMVRMFRDEMDADNNNEVDQGEFINHCKKMGCDTFVAAHLFDAIDVNNDDSLNLDEIFRFVSSMEAGDQAEKLECVYSFLVGGSNKDSLSRGACKKIVKRLGYDEKEANDIMRGIFKASGSSTSGTVSRDSFVSNISSSDGMEGVNIINISTRVVDMITSGSTF